MIKQWWQRMMAAQNETACAAGDADRPCIQVRHKLGGGWEMAGPDGAVLSTYGGEKEKAATEPLVVIGRCDACIFWARWEPTDSHPGHFDFGDCRRHAPQLIALTSAREDHAPRHPASPMTRPSTKWPSTRDNAGCGEWQPLTADGAEWRA